MSQNTCHAPVTRESRDHHHTTPHQVCCHVCRWLLWLRPKTKNSLLRACGDWPWSMNGNEIHRLAHSINAHRPDWMISSLTTFLSRNMATWTYRDAAVAMTWIATDAKPDGQPASDTPKRVLEQGPWRTAAAAGGSASVRTHAPKAHEECRTHAGQWAHNCGACRVEACDNDEPVSPSLSVPLNILSRLERGIGPNKPAANETGDSA